MRSITTIKLPEGRFQTFPDKSLSAHTEKAGELPTSLPMGCTWATHGNFAMQIRLPTTSIYGNSGQLSRRPTTSKYEKSGQLSGQRSWLPMGSLSWKLGCPLLPYMETVGSSVGSPLLQKMKKWAAQWAMDWAAHVLPLGILPCKLGCPLLPYTDKVGNSVGSPLLSSMEIVYFENCTTWHSYIQTYKMAYFNTSFILYKGICSATVNSDCI